MTALITSNSYSNYTADFAFLSGAISRFKPNKIVSSNPLPLRELPTTNLLRNRELPKKALKKTSLRLGERVQNLFKKQAKETPKPYSLRSADLDNPVQRKLISTTNQNLKQSSGVNRYSWQKPLQNIENPNQTKTSRIYNSRVEARLNSSAKAQAKKAVKENPLRTLSGKDRVNQTIQTKAEAKRIVKNNPVQIGSKPKRQNYLRQVSMNPYYPISQ
jgi:hypothetical protein